MPPPPPPPSATIAAGPVEAAPPPRSLGRAHRSVAVPPRSSFWRKFGAFTGPAYLVAVGYMDPGNWATGLAGGSRYGYALLWVIVLSSLMAMLFQALSARLGIVTGHDLAQACRARYPRAVRVPLWLLAEVAIIACDLAEVIGTAIAFQLLFGVPLALGVCLTALNVVIATLLERKGFRRLECLTVALIVVVAGSLAAELVLARPDAGAVAAGLLPDTRRLADPTMLFIAAGILGATIMPHNLYLHSAVVQTRRFPDSAEGKREAIRFATLDNVLALGLAMAINAAILILAASVFHAGGLIVEDIGQAYHLLSPMLGSGAASVLFGAALLASGQNSTLTGTLAGQVVMEGFTDLRMPAWARRALSRGLAIIPAAAVAMLHGNDGIATLLIASQVILSLQLPFAILPLLHLTSDRAWMGGFVNPRWVVAMAWLAAALVICLGAKLLLDLL